ncbi:MAG: hypothetical protein GC204_05350 [Chloroflexi bacterium]|nr:hypothetical protein [Chloroflexota bacterium]
MDTVQPVKCTHTVLENDIHEFALADSSIASYEAYMQILEKIYELRTADSPTMRTLFDSGKTNLPISYSMKRGKELMDKFPHVGKIRTAILTDSLFETHLVDSFMRLLRFPNTHVRFFAVSRRDEAIEWLLQDN